MSKIGVGSFQKTTGYVVLDQGTKKGELDAKDQIFKQGVDGLTPVGYLQALSAYEAAFEKKAGGPRLQTPEKPNLATKPMTNDQLLFCQGKSVDRVKSDFARRLQTYDVIIGTKASVEQYEALKADPLAKGARITFDVVSSVLTVERGEPVRQGSIVVACGGPTDAPVAEEAARIAEAMGNKVTRVYDFAHADEKTKAVLKNAGAVIAIAGSLPELPNQIAALTKAPVLATPTSAAFGTGLSGVEHLLPLFKNAAPGVSVVNTDNGFGAAYVADKINRDAAKAQSARPATLGWDAQEPEGTGKVVITTAGTADIPVAEKTAQDLEKKGVPVLRLYDRGVNDPERVEQCRKIFENAAAIVVAAGLEGGLPNAVAAMTQRPIISVPTSVGYGTGQGGVASLMCSLNACSPGISVVNIDDDQAAADAAEKIASHVIAQQTAGLKAHQQ